MAEARPKDLSKIRSTIERRAYLIDDLMMTQAQRIVDSTAEPPPGTDEPEPAEVRLMWTFSPFPDPEKAFWMLHDETLGQALMQISTQPMDGAQRMKLIEAAHAKAETVALSRVYPHRLALCQVGVTTLERSVQLAERASRLARQETKREPEREEAPAY